MVFRNFALLNRGDSFEFGNIFRCIFISTKRTVSTEVKEVP